MPRSPIIVIPARLAATRLPDKPLADIHGEPMIVHVWRRAQEAAVGPVVVACGDQAIADAIAAAGGNAIMTRSDHASGSDRVFEALEHVDPDGRHDAVINLQGDLPTIEPKAVQAVLMPLADPAVDIATLAARITSPEERDNPSVVKAAVSFGDASGAGVLPIARALYFSR
ncbi:MAG TPA: NTP transferase domain-containing protein, partial [Dongiaceae bacterium]|nr:NTP transferase domain-containing protein [Dongiaceae bacterium]